MPVQNDKSRLNLVADEPISITVDASDLTGASAEPLKGIIARYGRPISAKAFADFQQTSLAELAVQLYQLGFTLVHCPTWPNGDGFPKSVVSDILAQDLRDQLEELEGVETFLIAATSREYIAVANALRRHDKRVVVIAEEAKVARELRLCADEFVVLPPTKPERIQATRSSRTAARTEAVRLERPAETPRADRAPEPIKVDRVAEPTRLDRVVEPLRVERSPEVQRAERVAEPAKAEATDQTRLPSDLEVVAEVRRIVAAEGICTPRRLARALCPVDRTPTGELRSRIANRIQSLVDGGKLSREKLVVGGTSVETIIVGEDKTERPAQPVVEAAPAEMVESLPELTAEVEAPEEIGPVAGNGFGHDEALPVDDLPPATVRAEEVVDHKAGQTAGSEIDAFVESFLRSAGAAGKLHKRQEAKREEPKREEPKPEELPAPEVAQESAPANESAVTEPEAAAQETPAKKPRSRRRSTSKKAAPEAEPAS